MENALLYILAFSAMAIALFACVLPQSPLYSELLGLPNLTRHSWSFIDTFENGLQWDKAGNAGDYGIELSTTYAYAQTHSLKTYTRTSGWAVDDMCFGAFLAPIGGTEVLLTDFARLSGQFERYYNSYTKYVQFEIIRNNGTHTLPAEIRYDHVNHMITAKTTGGERINVSAVPVAFSYSIWHYFQLDVNFTAGTYLKFILKGADCDLNIDLSNVLLTAESEVVNPQIVYYIGIQSNQSISNVVCYWDQVLCSAESQG